MKNNLLSLFGLIIFLYISATFNSGCAQIGAPTGGVKDTLAPVLVKASPEIKALNFKGNKITLSFDEYVEVLDVQNNVMVSPLQKNTPTISSNLKTITIKLRDSLQPNTTYSINFGNAIRDINEANIFSNFTYVFSTGNTIDSLSLSGKVLLAETGLADSTLSVLLYSNTNDTAVQKLRPNYITKLKGDGSFQFEYLPEADFKIYALKDGDGGKTYNAKTELFAFRDSVVNINGQNNPIALFAYSDEKPSENKITPVLKPLLDKRLKYSSNLAGTQDLLLPLELKFNNRLKVFDTAKINLTDTNYNKIFGARVSLDSTLKIISFTHNWKPGEAYRIIIAKDAVQDSLGTSLVKNDTLKFSAKLEADYGRITLRFKNYEQSKNPVLQFIINQVVKYAYPLTGAEWSNKRFPPGEYELRILYDVNKDGLWTPGNYLKKLQPEKAITLPQKLAIRADWDNEREIEL